MRPSILVLFAAAAPQLWAQAVVGTLTRPNFEPISVAVSETENKVFVADDASGNLYIYDGGSNQELGSVAIGTGCYELLVHEGAGKVYAGCGGQHKIAVVDAHTGAFLHFIDAGIAVWLAKDEALGNVYALHGLGFSRIVAASDAVTLLPDIKSQFTRQIQVNPVTHEVHMSSLGNVLDIVDGATLEHFSIPGLKGLGLGVNWNENKVVIADGLGHPFRVYDRDTGMTKTLQSFNDSTRLVFNDLTNRMYTRSENNKLATIIDGATDATFDLPLDGGFALAVRRATDHVYLTGGGIFAVAGGTQELVYIPPEEPLSNSGTSGVAINEITGRVYVLNGSNPDRVTVLQDPEALRPRIFVADGAARRVAIIDPELQRVVDEFQPSLWAGYGVAVAPDGGRIYLGDDYPEAFPGAIRVLAGMGGRAELARVDVGKSPLLVAVSPDQSRVYVSNAASDVISVVDTSTNTVAATVPVGSHPLGLAVRPDGDELYVANRDDGTVSVLRTADHQVTATIPLGASKQPWGLAFNPAGTKAYVANSGDGTVSVIDTATRRSIRSIPVGSQPKFVAVSPKADHVYVTNSGSNSVSVIDAATEAVVKTVSVGTAPLGIAVMPDASAVYVSNELAGTVSVIDTTATSVSRTITIPPYLTTDHSAPRGLAITDTTAKIAGRVSACGSPLAGATVRALQSNLQKGTATTDASGDYSIHDMTAGTYDVEAQAASYAPQSRPAASIGIGRTLVLHFTLALTQGQCPSPTATPVATSAVPPRSSLPVLLVLACIGICTLIRPSGAAQRYRGHSQPKVPAVRSA